MKREDEDKLISIVDMIIDINLTVELVGSLFDERMTCSERKIRKQILPSLLLFDFA